MSLVGVRLVPSPSPTRCLLVSPPSNVAASVNASVNASVYTAYGVLGSRYSRLRRDR